MKKSIYQRARQFSVVETPEAVPGPGEVSLAVAYCGICGTDMHIFHGKMDGRVKPPQTVGHEMSGRVAAVGPGVTAWKKGDRVTVRPLVSCGKCPACQAGFGHVCMNLNFVGIDSPGAFQESWVVPAAILHRLPEDLPIHLGALIEPLAVACHDVRRARLVKGETAVVLGAGPIGLFVAMVARESGAHVTVVERDNGRRDFAKALGFETLPSDENTKEAVHQKTGGAGAHVVFECTGAPACALLMTHLVRVRGRVVVVGIFSEAPAVDLKQVFWREVEIIGARVYEPEDFDRAIALAASGKLPLEAMVTTKRPLTEIQQAFEGAASGMKTLVACGAE